MTDHEHGDHVISEIWTDLFIDRIGTGIFQDQDHMDNDATPESNYNIFSVEILTKNYSVKNFLM